MYFFTTLYGNNDLDCVLGRSQVRLHEIEILTYFLWSLVKETAMSEKLSELVSLLDLKEGDRDTFTGQSQDLGFPSVYGGQVLGQALSAAIKTVSERVVHSLHGYFLRQGDANAPIQYVVDRIRDGKSFTTRRVIANQFGRPIFNMSVSFQVMQKGHEHQDEMPTVKGPEGLLSDLELARRFSHRIPERVRGRFTSDRPLEIRTVNPIDPFNPVKKEGKSHSWVRVQGQLQTLPEVHSCILAYASDFSLLATSMLPHGLSFADPKLQITSLDHSMWFHRPVDMNDWLLYQKDSPCAAGARGFSRGQIFTKDGLLVASVCQEGLIRDYRLLSDETSRI